ncbi:putative bifunctional diguanylate cyclase/phosphodiesterase [Ancylobacter lacus]|uniref:putative bifunctional diguanylate cyclase/phosphodiesterase n=1 Tax=Ancylobacter lacus TaxID=2579970 RepID=UPI001BCEADEB|nr:EAL domain-containing protein [Ancylobacter lacus]MBS7540301.1 EAL domain-containing protein [Ancylobacter lacus]
MPFPVPEQELERLASLHALGILDGEPVADLEGVCRLARDLLKVQSVCVGLVDRDQQIIKARAGTELIGTSREHSFSTWTILSDELLVVPDAREDERFARNIYVVGAPHIRFYAGAPIGVRAGLNVGSLCIFDPEPRQITPEEESLIRQLARILSDQLRLHEATARTRLELMHRRTSQGLLEVQSRELWRRQNLLAQTERLARVGGWEMDLSTDRITWSDGVYRIYGLAPGTPLTHELVLSHFPKDARLQLEERLQVATETGAAFEMALPFITVRGENRIVRVACNVEAERGEHKRFFGILQDITEQREFERRMWHIANHDALTDLPNRGLLRERLDYALRRARRAASHVCLMLIDLDNFKDVNDTLGHDAGDALLIEAARRLSASVGATDAVARLGGDEFVVLLDGVKDAAAAMAVAERILGELRRPFTFRRTLLNCRGSMGLALAPDHGSDPSELLRNADIALYRAKARGRDVVVGYDAAMREATENRIQLAGCVRAALENGEFVPYYQPEVSLETGEIIGFEALLRWRHPRKGLLGPSHFGQAFEDTDLAIALGERVLALALCDIRDWLTDGLAFGRISINVSSAEFSRGEYGARVLAALAAAEVSPDRLMLEVTESVFLGQGIERVRSSLQMLHAAGVLIALDDFGTGYASLTHLKQFPVDIIKIDRSFVSDLERDADDAAIVRAVINLGHSLGIRTVAEGVETSSQAAYLRQHGCDIAQGYLYARALPAARVPWLLQTLTPEETRLLSAG